MSARALGSAPRLLCCRLARLSISQHIERAPSRSDPHLTAPLVTAGTSRILRNPSDPLRAPIPRSLPNCPEAPRPANPNSPLHLNPCDLYRDYCCTISVLSRAWSVCGGFVTLPVSCYRFHSNGLTHFEPPINSILYSDFNLAILQLCHLSPPLVSLRTSDAFIFHGATRFDFKRVITSVRAAFKNQTRCSL
ncbi:hypothetical protein B0H15DRAFT_437881 [Mycena belliarum]|uniref:Uncharacterized protein n=1 Tax=Mycena belliarum TaxID=1033014 RepID=A0AAD6TX83_9AGAR|nr:hypothetical protein B0H15DRAFT_437881 [Mycena belliae]